MTSTPLADERMNPYKKELDYVVIFDCEGGEAVIRTGTFSEVSQPDALGCPVKKVMLLSDVRLKTIPWTKDGELRCEIDFSATDEPNTAC